MHGNLFFWLLWQKRMESIILLKRGECLFRFFASAVCGVCFSWSSKVEVSHEMFLAGVWIGGVLK